MDIGEFAELVAIAHARKKTYSLLARLYRAEVDAHLLEDLRTLEFGSQGTADDGVAEGYQMMRADLDGGEQTLLTALAVDYARVFLGAGQTSGQVAYPYESVYTSADHLIMQESRDQVVDCYRKQGLAVAEGLPEPEDHIAFELEFMAALAALSAGMFADADLDRAESLLRVQESFLSDHLLNWTPRFFQHLGEFAVTNFYKGLAKVTRGFLVADSEFLAGVLADDLTEEESEAMAL